MFKTIFVYSKKDTQQKRQSTKWEKTIANHISDKRLISIQRILNLCIIYLLLSISLIYILIYIDILTSIY